MQKSWSKYILDWTFFQLNLHIYMYICKNTYIYIYIRYYIYIIYIILHIDIIIYMVFESIIHRHPQCSVNLPNCKRAVYVWHLINREVWTFRQQNPWHRTMIPSGMLLLCVRWVTKTPHRFNTIPIPQSKIWKQCLSGDVMSQIFSTCQV